MSRVIKFRVWDKKSLIYRDQIPAVESWWDTDTWDDSEQLMEDPFIALDVGAQFAHRLIWEQFTGFQCEDGHDIYEGDILGASRSSDWDEDVPMSFRAEVRWIDGALRARETQGCEEHDMNWCHWKLLGNIHQNPELLK